MKATWLLTPLILSLAAGAAAASETADTKINKRNTQIDRGCTMIIEARQGYQDRPSAERSAMNRKPENSSKIDECVNRYRIQITAT
ncbi:MAG: hypothetical protein JO171_11415 [Paludibacterium sp.]|uniref:hypothetical protein n=1 Tax=Paludibacterium sp. TaxID=1917523 RepID=UPI0025D18E6C|nr:hypothetical protein [Paludibacterium sp.]MBV8047756.1 hypothetical protein [Paludibacterium sp.]MBV8648088.1 hypothetical protein [Paludibacterium sp.]